MDIGGSFVENNGVIDRAIMPDYLHFSPAGYGVWAASIEDHLAQLLGDLPVRVEHVKLGGDWTFTMDTPDGRVDSKMTLHVVGARLHGVVEFGPDRKLVISEGGFFRDQINFKVRRDRPQGGELIYNLQGKVSDAKIQGKVSTELDGEKVTMDWSAVR